MKQKFLAIILAVFLLSVALVSAERLVLDASLEEGETRAYMIDGTEYMVSLVIVSDSRGTVKFNINGKISTSLREGDSYDVTDTLYLRVDAIRPNEADEETGGDFVDFSIFDTAPYCGDAVCNAEETCSSCEQDCGECVLVCGDGICHPGESCEQDNCCGGNEIDLTRNYFFCGSCRNSCNAFERCVSSQCTGTCGNGYCESNEDQQSCPADCGQPPECAVDIDCDDGDACTVDLCSRAGTCFNMEDKVCLAELEVAPEMVPDEIVEEPDEVVPEPVEPIQEDVLQESLDNEQQPTIIVEKKEDVIQKVFGWIMKLFGI